MSGSENENSAQGHPTRSARHHLETSDSNRAPPNGDQATDDSFQLSQKKVRSFQEDDEEITALERKLGLKNKKLTKAFDDDGLTDLLEDITVDHSADSASKKRKIHNEEWLQRKRRRSGASDRRSEAEIESDDASISVDDAELHDDDNSASIR